MDPQRMHAPSAFSGNRRVGVLATLVAVGLAVIVAAACGPSPAALEQVAIDFSTAVQERDFDRLFCLSAGAAESADLGANPTQRREVFEDWALAEYERYELGRDEGSVALSGHGITLVKLFGLGGGTFAQYDLPRRGSEGTMRLSADLRFGYRAVDLSAFSPGTTFYLTGAPVGTVHAVVVPRGFREVTLDVLETLRVEWTLVESAGGEVCPAGWTVAGVRPVEETAVTARLMWAF